MDLLEEDDEEIKNIFIEPPEASNMLTDEDSGDDDGEGEIDNLNGKQLQQPASVLYKSGRVLGGIDPVNEDGASCSNVGKKRKLTKGIKVKKTTENKNQSEVEWDDSDLSDLHLPIPEPYYSKYSSMSPVDIFECFLSTDVISMLVQGSGKYASFLNDKNPDISCGEMKVF